MKMWTWILGLGALVLAWYIYQQQQLSSAEQAAALEGQLDDLQDAQTEDYGGLTVSGMSAASGLVNTFSNLFSSSPTSGGSASSDFGSSDDYATDFSSYDDE